MLFGNLAPNGAVVKVAGVAADMMEYEGPARIYESQEAALAGILAGESAGAHVVAITATHHHAIETSHPRLSSYEEVATDIEADGSLRLVYKAG